MADDEEILWDEVAKVAAEAARIKAQRDVTWYLWAIGKLRKALGELITGLTDAIQTWMLANGLSKED
jgi:hypothetical protein